MIHLQRIPGFNGCHGLWLFVSLRDRILLVLGFNRYHADLRVDLNGKELVLGPSIQHRYEN